MKLQEATMPYVSCPTAVIDTRVDVAWALLMNPAAWGGVFDMRVGSIDPPGPAVVEQKISGETGPRLLHLKLTFRMIEIDPHQRRLCLDVICRLASLFMRISAVHHLMWTIAGSIIVAILIFRGDGEAHWLRY
jgi:hypothetical protein